MNTSPAVLSIDRTIPRTTVRNTSLLLIFEGFLMFGPLIILGAAINWPQILDQPAQVVLPTILAQLGGMRLGYAVYLLYSVLFFPVMFLIARTVTGEKPFGSTLQVASTMAALSTLARCIGIIRWLVAMPVLAELYATGQNQTSIQAIYQVLNAFGGSIGEALGVSLFAAIAVGLTSYTLLRSDTLPRWLGWLGLLSAASLAVPLLEIFGITIGPLIIASVAVVQVWFLAFGFFLLVQSNQHS